MQVIPIVRGQCFEGIVLAAVFALAHTQSPLFFSNQNQYLLHGFASAHVDHLNNDWLANTADPTPAFSWLVAGLYRVSAAFGIHAIYFLLLMVYYSSIRSLVQSLPGFPDHRSFRLAFAALFIAFHAAMLRVVSVAASGTDYPWYFQAGVAGQYVLGPGLQPSAFGVLLLTGLALVARGRILAACFVGTLPALMHSTYFLPVTLFVLGLAVALIRNHQIRKAIYVCVISGLTVLPAILYTLQAFSPTNSEVFGESTRILAEVRIPHHCMIARWFDWLAFLQFVWIVWGLSLFRRTTLFPILTTMGGLGLGLSLVQYAIGGSAFALLFPWRVSVFLMPLATAIVLAKLAAMERPGPVVIAISSAILFLLAAGGVAVMVQHRGYKMNEDENALYEWVRENRREGDVYLLPVQIPAVGSGRGSVSMSFMPPPRPKPGSNLIPVDLQRFRLVTGQPIYVDFKAVPYKDVEVLEWYRRMRQCEAWYASDWKIGIRDSLVAEGITHVVVPRHKPIRVAYLQEVHVDSVYLVYRIK